MTEDYKEKLLKYMTHNLQKQEGVNIPDFSELKTFDATSVYDQISQAFPYGTQQNGVVQCKNVDGEYNGFIIVYGLYFTNNSHTFSSAKGYMLLFDNNFELVQIIKQYKSGTDLGIMMKISVMDDGTLIALDHYDNRNRFLMLNNPSVKLPSAQNYQLVLRQSYNLQGNVANMNYQSVGKMYYLDKDPNSSNYMIAELDEEHGIKNITKFKINVGSTNEWTNYTFYDISQMDGGIQVDVNYIYIYWENETPHIYVYLTFIYNTGIYHGLLGTFRNFEGTYIDVDDWIYELEEDPDQQTYCDSNINFISPTNIYYTYGIGKAYEDGDLIKTDCKLQTIHMTYDSQTQQWSDMVVYADIFTQDSTNELFGGWFDIETYNLNGTQCIIYSTITDRTGTYQLMKTVGVLITSQDYSTRVILGYPYFNKYSQFHINTIINQFDLYKYFFMYEDFEAGWVLNESDIIYNYLYYNGAPYENVNSLRANQGMLFDINGNIFVRGIYNHVVADNTTEDTIQVPNTMVNNIQITQNKLMSQTNIPMVINNDTIEKNIYETLYINYFNTINMENRNTAYYIQNRDGAIRVNNAISNLLDYDNMTITKIKINYHDSTNMISEIQPATITNGVATFTFSVYTGKAIDSIDLISDDEATTYISIDATGYQLNKLYNISQNCFIE